MIEADENEKDNERERKIQAMMGEKMRINQSSLSTRGFEQDLNLTGPRCLDLSGVNHASYRYQQDLTHVFTAHTLKYSSTH